MLLALKRNKKITENRKKKPFGKSTSIDGDRKRREFGGELIQINLLRMSI